MSEAVDSTTPAGQRGLSRAMLGAGAVALAGLTWAYWPSLLELWWRWSNDPNYSHGYFVVPIALAILWQRRPMLERLSLRPAWWGLVFLALVLGVRAYLYEVNEQFLEGLTLIIAATGVVAAVGGLGALRWAWPGLLFLIFMFPMPESINGILALRLQSLATSISTWALRLMGLPAIAEGNVILVGSEHLEVARACSGLSMLLTFVTLITAVVLLIDLPRWQKAVLLLSAIPIAVVSNILRIIVTGWAYYQFGPQKVVFGDWTIERLTHDPAGWAMMPVALGLVWLELSALSWLVVEEEVEGARLPVVVPQAMSPAVVKKA